MKKTLKYQTNQIKRASRPYRKPTRSVKVLRYPKIRESKKRSWALRKLKRNNRVKTVKALDQTDDEGTDDRIQKSQFFR